MDRRRYRKYDAQQRALVVCVEHRPYLDTAPGSRRTVAKLDRAVDAITSRLAQQATCRIEQRTAAERCRAARRCLRALLRHVVIVSRVVSREDGEAHVFETPPYASDDDLIARAEAIHQSASAHAELFVSEGVVPGLFDRLAGEIDAFKRARAAVTLARLQFTQATAAIDRALEEGDKAIAVLDGILAPALGGPVGASVSFRQAKRIGPRVAESPQPQSADVIAFPLEPVDVRDVNQPAALAVEHEDAVKRDYPLRRTG